MRVREKIVAVDDEIGALILIAIMLERADFDVVRCRLAVDALTILKTVTPSLIIVDYMMPGMDGIQLLQEIRKDPKTAKTPVLMLSARNDPRQGEMALALGANAFLVKPILHHDLVAKVRQMLVKAEQPPA